MYIISHMNIKILMRDTRYPVPTYYAMVTLKPIYSDLS